MTYTTKFRPASNRVVAVYTCPEHGEMDVEVERDERGDAPDVVDCPVNVADDGEMFVLCEAQARWTPSPVTCRVRRFEAVRGGWEKPERSTFLDTRKLGEGQSIEEFRAERKAVWEERRKEEVMQLKKGF